MSQIISVAAACSFFFEKAVKDVKQVRKRNQSDNRRKTRA